MKRTILFLAIITLNFGLTFARPNKPVVAATYNLRMNTPKDGINAWPNRKEAVKSLVRFHEFDIFGTQEGFIGQLKDLCELEGFTYTGHGREDGKDAGEHSAIVYRTDRFKLLDSGDFWLRENPDEPGLGWDATCCNRICSWGKFRDLETAKEFFFFCVHFDHQGVIARKESGKLMIKKIQEIAGGCPVICVGDLNSTPETEQIKTLQTLLKDSYEVSVTPPYGPVGTFNGFDFNSALKSRIDYIFVSKKIDVLKYGVLTDNVEQRYPSDHLPVVIKAIIH
ncbi:MAG: endonuclease [Bacteroidetes bacterium GWF2_42_66]|nr:MAG: endonuclease [Bacteroidetes bacterium GWA2_42_15]OFY01922.1 MAG: endonuclease [Bacteroidetes bacterium GWE2_42_39]OFY44782.1 MAG: endonuclease [Bacteroidetes bacterium GWF2_42_66]HBL75907.1 endonuclease [Prolixibacteraceae bacterium]HCR89153.1 endonuclease [Prolixibacteraceae bacterium]